MGSNTESTSNSIKFVPMPISALLASLGPLHVKTESPDASFSSGDDSDSSSGRTVAKKPSTPTKTKKEFLTPSMKAPPPKDIKVFASEKKIPHKENSDDIWSSNRTYPNKDSKKAHKFAVAPPSFDPTKPGVLTPQNTHNNNSKLDLVISSHIKTPEIKPPSAQKLKSATPKIKSGIRRFTPGSGKKSAKRTPVYSVAPTRDKVRCELFGQKQREEVKVKQPEHQVMAPVPETPIAKKLMPASYAATPSYPQGIVGGKFKALFKTTTIKDKKYMFTKKLGTGGSSEVYKVLEISTFCEYAVKCVQLATDPDLAQGYINEVRLLRELQNSDRVIKLYDYEYDHAQQTLRLVMEAGETDLSSFLRARGAGLTPTLVLHYWEEMLHAVHYIHEHGVIHADLKPANFLLVSGRLKLIDFGIASAISSDATSVVRSQATGTYSYISPEALLGGAGGGGGAPGQAPIKISFRSDVWSLGCILYSMVYGRTPFGHLPSLAKLAAILDPNHKIDFPPVQLFPDLPPSLLAALKWCLKYNTRARPSVRELLSIPYLRPPLPPALLDKLTKHAPLAPHEYKMLLANLTGETL